MRWGMAQTFAVDGGGVGVKGQQRSVKWPRGQYLLK